LLSMGQPNLSLLSHSPLGRPSGAPQDGRCLPSLHAQTCFPRLRHNLSHPAHQFRTPNLSEDKHLARHLRHLCRAASVLGKEKQQEDQDAQLVQEIGFPPHHNGTNGAHAEGEGLGPELCDPEAFTLEPGVLSLVDRTGEGAASDVFRCSGCTLKECQVWDAPLPPDLSCSSCKG
jgi:hypothetical protein